MPRNSSGGTVPKRMNNIACDVETDLANLRLSVCEARLARHPEQLDLLIPCAIALRQLGRMDEAVERLRKAQGEPSLRSRASLQLGMCLQQMGDVTGALGAYRKAALYRSPAPSPDLKKRALELAAELQSNRDDPFGHAVHTQLLIDAIQRKPKVFVKN